MPILYNPSHRFHVKHFQMTIVYWTVLWLKWKPIYIVLISHDDGISCNEFDYVAIKRDWQERWNKYRTSRGWPVAEISFSGKSFYFMNYTVCLKMRRNVENKSKEIFTNIFFFRQMKWSWQKTAVGCFLLSRLKSLDFNLKHFTQYFLSLSR